MAGPETSPFFCKLRALLPWRNGVLEFWRGVFMRLIAVWVVWVCIIRVKCAIEIY